VPENRLYVTVYTRENIIYQGPAVSVTSFNKEGKFDVLSKHMNFISIINDKAIIKDLQGVEREVPVDSGVMKVANNKVDIYLGMKK